MSVADGKQSSISTFAVVATVVCCSSFKQHVSASVSCSNSAATAFDCHRLPHPSSDPPVLSLLPSISFISPGQPTPLRQTAPLFRRLDNRQARLREIRGHGGRLRLSAGREVGKDQVDGNVGKEKHMSLSSPAPSEVFSERFLPSSSASSLPLQSGGETRLGRYRCRLAYDGTDFLGFQSQGGRDGQGGSSKATACRIGSRGGVGRGQARISRTVTEEVERAVNTRFHRERGRGSFEITVCGASRTDKGVHARGQAVHFDLPVVLSEDALARHERALNGLLPPDVKISQLSLAGIRDLDLKLWEEERRRRREDRRSKVLEGRVRLAEAKKRKRLRGGADQKDDCEQRGSEVCPPGDSGSDAVLATVCCPEEGDSREDSDIGGGGKPSDGVPGFPGGEYEDDERGRASEFRENVWHARKNAVGKLYSYRFAITPDVPPLERRIRASLPAAISRKGRIAFDPHRVGACLDSFVGTRDFRSFANKMDRKDAQGGGQFDSVRTIRRLDLVNEDRGDDSSLYWRLDFYLDGALFKMVRNIVGSLMAVGAGMMEKEDIEALFEQKDRRQNVAVAAPACGLTLEHVFYPDW